MIRTTPTGPPLRVEELECRETPAVLFGITPRNVLVTFDSARPTVLLQAVRFQGFVQPGEVITDIDVRPATGQLFGQSNLGRLYQITPSTGLVIPLGDAIPLPSLNVGMDFDPRTDRIRILGNQGENVVREATFGLFVRRANDLQYAPGDFSEGFDPRITGAAFFNNVPDAPFRVLYGIDHARNTLVRVGRTTLDDGLVTTVGGLGRDVTNRVGLDIAPESNVMFASLQTRGQAFSRLYHMNYATGEANPVGRIGGGLLINDIAVDLRGISGFTSRAGFGVFAPPTGIVFGSASFSSLGAPPGGFSPISFPTTTAPFAPISTGFFAVGGNGTRVFF